MPYFDQVGHGPEQEISWRPCPTSGAPPVLKSRAWFGAEILERPCPTFAFVLLWKINILRRPLFSFPALPEIPGRHRVHGKRAMVAGGKTPRGTMSYFRCPRHRPGASGSAQIKTSNRCKMLIFLSKTKAKVGHGRPRISAPSHALLRGPSDLGKVGHGPEQNSWERPRPTFRDPGLSGSRAWFGEECLERPCPTSSFVLLWETIILQRPLV